MRILGVFALAVMVAASAPAAPKGDKGKGGGKGGGGASVEAALGFLEARMGPAGLIDSFVEDNADYAYTYDNALAAMAFLSAGETASVVAILDAFAAIGAEPDGGFLHRYASTDGGPAYGLSRVGHNAYLLQAMALYRLATGDPAYDGLAAGVADFLLAHQDADGGLFGGAGATWKSTENNLAAYAALESAGKVFGDLAHAAGAASVRAFLIAECWDGERFLTGENDPMIVTDVQALGAMILGPAYANGAYWVEGHTLTTQRYQGRKRVTGFDLNTDRDTVWTEGTLQQALAFLTVGDTGKSDAYRAEAERLAQSSGAFWQASNAGTTGFGESFMRWQAAAPTTWYVFVANQDNVLAPIE